MFEIVVSVILFTVIALAEVALIRIARRALVPNGVMMIRVNGRRSIEATPGDKLISTLAHHKLILPSACGGGGTCGQCMLRVLSGGGAILPTEKAQINRRRAREGFRLGCQLTVRGDMDIEVPAAVLGARKWDCTVVSNRNVATFIKELTLRLPEGAEDFSFRAGGYILLDVPPHDASFDEFDIPDKFRADWDRFDMWKLRSVTTEPVVRAYSMANWPGEKGRVMLDIRIAPPPRGAPPETPPGNASSWVFSLRPGDAATISGPFGDFFIHEEGGDREMIYVGGGAGMAPLRSHIFELLKGRNSKRTISYWYGGRSKREVFYDDEFEELTRAHDNFSLHIALSDPLPEDNWTGPTGFIHQVLLDEYLARHPAPEDCEYYLCGPPMMVSAMRTMLDELGVEADMIFSDDFGG